MKHIILTLLAFAFLLGSVHALQITSYNVEPSPVLPGQTFTLYAYVYNETPLAAKDVQFQLVLGENSQDTSFPYSIEPTDSLIRNLGTIPAFTTVQVQYQIQVDPSASDGVYPVQLLADSGFGGGGKLDAPIQILSRTPVLTLVQSSPSFALVGQTLSLELTLKNTGSSPAYDIIISLDEDRTVTSTGAVVERSIVPLGASASFVGELLIGDTKTITIPVSISPTATSKAYFVPVTIDYYDSNRSAYSSTDYLGLKVSGEPELNAYPSDSVPLPSPGKASRVSIDIFNTGLGPAKFVTASVQSDIFQSNQSDYFIGTIESDDFDTIVMDTIVSPSASPGMHPVSVTIHYKNEYGDAQSFTKNVDVRVYSSSEASNGGNGDSSLLPLIMVLLLAVGLVWWFRFRKKGNGKGK